MNGHSTNKKYKKLASRDVPITDVLFGNDLKGTLAAIDNVEFTQSRVGRLLSHPKPVPPTPKKKKKKKKNKKKKERGGSGWRGE